MKIDRTNNINFNARYIGSGYIGKFSKTEGKILPEKVSFIELDPKNKIDFDAIKNANRFWQYELFMTNIYDCAKEIANGHIEAKANKIYALTGMKKGNLEKITDDNIFCFVHAEKKEDMIDLHYIQANPEYIYAIKRDYYGIGTAMISCLKKFKLPIELKSRRSQSIKNFYVRNGFNLVNPETRIYRWTPN